MDGLVGALLRIIIFLPLVAVLAYLSIKYGLGKTQQFKGTSNLQVVERLTLGPKSSLYVVKVVDRYYLLAVGEGQTTLLKELDDYPATQVSLNQEFKGFQLFDSWQRPFIGGKFNQRGKTS